MRLRDISSREVIDRSHGQKLGTPGALDVVIDETTGSIKEFVFPTSPALPFKKRQKEWSVPWDNIEQIGEDFIIIRS
ncbi:YlmC/YmxH family sporulation protein [Alteribacillus iranensis]|uniref:Sporulation protein, YlmC/YmxH family n=1 Tax=Alteribacillus iranensis TaxID=930128 RepID=A0A1I2A2Q8_9BACI|nr:YlmC/YmxH family sporulation protein [Alteribacillus iranensis]SFE38067.1 sporulation protein, YlmC/YmxH family [Alteribacillus iranensis]